MPLHINYPAGEYGISAGTPSELDCVIRTADISVGLFFCDFFEMTRCWFLDLDDTIYEASGGMLREIHLRMNDYIARTLNISLEQAHALRSKYWATYGSTFIALWRLHRIDPVDFLTKTHDFDPAPYIHYSGDVAADLSALEGMKVVYTNGPRIYAQRVLEYLGITAVVDDLVCSTEMRLFGDWRPKPSASMLLAQCARYGVNPAERVLVDDTWMNLKAAKAARLKTVWCTGYRLAHGRITHRQAVAYVDAHVRHISELKKIRF